MKVIIIGRKNCKWCREARKLCREADIEYAYKDIEHRDNAPLRHWMEIENIKTVPQIFLDGEHLGGYEDLAKRLSD